MTYKPSAKPDNTSYIPTVDDLSYGLFILDKIQLNGRLGIIPGLRYGRYDYQPDGILHDGSPALGIRGSKLTGRF